MFGYQYLVVALGALAALCADLPARAQEEPARIVLPWRTPGIDGDQVAQARNALNETFTKLGEAWLPKKTTLADYFSAKPLPANRRSLAKTILVSSASSAASGARYIYEPIWCSLADQHVLMLTAANLESDVYIAIVHQLIPRRAWEDAIENEELPGLLTPALTKLRQQLDQKLQATAAALPENALHIGINSAMESTRADAGSNFCKNLLLSEKLVSDYLISRFVGDEALFHFRDLFRARSKVMRPTRTLTLAWQPLVLDFHKAPALPLKMVLHASMSESVLGNRIADASQAPVEFDVVQQRAEFVLPEFILNWLKQESKALALDEPPRISKVYRAWVYLDKGRAYGLKINDRLVVMDGPQPISGHVVGFFGPDFKIKSPEGFPVNEGAIVYIRKGQRFTRVGQKLRFDPKTYPTAWPPTTAKK